LFFFFYVYVEPFTFLPDAGGDYLIFVAPQARLAFGISVLVFISKQVQPVHINRIWQII
jgi:hypothetical protein